MTSPTETTPPVTPQPAVTVGRTVHYQQPMIDSETELPAPLPAIVVAVSTEDPSVIAAHVFDIYEDAALRNIPFAELPTAGHWNWPPRVPAAL